MFGEYGFQHMWKLVENDHFIQLSTDDIDVDKENDEDKEDDRHDVIHIDVVVLPNDDEYCG